MADPVAWVLIEPGWRVLDSAGEEVGRVKEVTGDENVDIFDGLAIRQGILRKDTYVPSEHVAEIVEGEVRLSLTRAQVEALDSFEEPAAEEQIIPERSHWYQRLAWWTTGRNR
jgi:Uncharacterized protein conserved in bacteria (DUF2171)